MFASSLPRSDRTADQILGVSFMHDSAANIPNRRTRIIHTLKKTLRRKMISSDGPGFQWDVPNPFATPDPAVARLQALLYAEIVRTESIAPNERDPLYNREDFGSDTPLVNGLQPGENDSDVVVNDEDDIGIEGEDYTDTEDEDYEDEDYTELGDEDQPCDAYENTLAPIALPRLLPVSLRLDYAGVGDEACEDYTEDGYETHTEDGDTLSPIARPHHLPIPPCFITSPTSPTDEDEEVNHYADYGYQTDTECEDRVAPITLPPFLPIPPRFIPSPVSPTDEEGINYYAEGRYRTDIGYEDRLAPISLSPLFPIPPRYVPSRTSPINKEEEVGYNTDALPVVPGPWASLAQIYNNPAEEEERAARRARRDEYRSLQRVCAAFGPQATSAL